MPGKVQTGTHPADSAVSLTNVSKVFEQTQRENAGHGLLKNLLKPEKKIIRALDSVSFEVKRGECVAYAGPNGAGKSTTLKLLSGILVPSGDEGSLSVLSLSPRRDRVKLMSRMGVLFGNRTELWWDHPVSQSFEWKKTVWDIPDKLYKKNLEMLTELLDLGGIMKTFARELSLGQKMKADLALMLLHGPELILLDEPTLGLDVVAKRQMIGFLKKINRENGVTIVVTSHDMDDLEEMAERMIMIANGKIVFDGDFMKLRGLTGSGTRIHITLSDDTVKEMAADPSKTPIQSILREVSQMPGVKDIEIRKAPIEHVISELYAVWK